MSSKAFCRVLVIGLCGLMVVTSGCRRMRPGVKSGPDGEFDPNGKLTKPEFVEGDLPFGKERPAGNTENNQIQGLNFQTVLFAFDSFQVASGEAAKIEPVAAYMKENRDVRLVTEGHCDERGTLEYNMALGEHRALAVRAYLIGLGIEGDRIQTRSFGEEKPQDPGHSEAAWRVNRRVDFALYR